MWKLIEESIEFNMSMRRLAEVRKLKAKSMGHMLSKCLTHYSEQSSQYAEPRLRLNQMGKGGTKNIGSKSKAVPVGDGKGGPTPTISKGKGPKGKSLLTLPPPPPELSDSACCHLVGQVICPPKVVAANEDLDVSLDIERILARRDQERLSSYKLLQALRDQIHVLSKGMLCLACFCGPDDLALPLRSLKTGGHRSFDSDGKCDNFACHVPIRLVSSPLDPMTTWLS